MGYIQLVCRNRTVSAYRSHPLLDKCRTCSATIQLEYETDGHVDPLEVRVYAHHGAWMEKHHYAASSLDTLEFYMPMELLSQMSNVEFMAEMRAQALDQWGEMHEDGWPAPAYPLSSYSSLWRATNPPSTPEPPPASTDPGVAIGCSLNAQVVRMGWVLLIPLLILTAAGLLNLALLLS